VNALKKNFSQGPAGQYSTSTNSSTRQHHQAYEGRSGSEGEWVRALGALHSSRSKEKLTAEKWRATHFLNKKQKEKSIKDDVEKVASVAKKCDEDAETVIEQVEEEMRGAGNAGLTVRNPENMSEEMKIVIGDSLTDLGSCDNEEDGDDDDNQVTELGRLGKYDEPGWVAGTMCKMVHQRMERYRQKQMNLHELTQPGWQHMAHYFDVTDIKYGTTECKVPAHVEPQKDIVAAALALTPSGEHMESLDIVCGIWQIPQGTSRPESIHESLGSGKPQSNKRIAWFSPDMEPYLSSIKKSKPVEPASSYLCIVPPWLINIQKPDSDNEIVMAQASLDE